ncbi:MAG: hypothetical protein ACI4QT_06285 [Kiritimatiellia bacterium]
MPNLFCFVLPIAFHHLGFLFRRNGLEAPGIGLKLFKPTFGPRSALDKVLSLILYSDIAAE